MLGKVKIIKGEYFNPSKYDRLLQIIMKFIVNKLVHSLCRCILSISWILLICSIVCLSSCAANKAVDLMSLESNDKLAISINTEMSSEFIKFSLTIKNNSNKTRSLIYNSTSNQLMVNQCTEIMLRDSLNRLITVCPFKLINIDKLVCEDYTVIEAGQELITHINIKRKDMRFETNNDPCRVANNINHGKVIIQVLYKDNYLSCKGAIHKLESSKSTINL